MDRARKSAGRLSETFVDPAPDAEHTRRLKTCSVVAYSEATLLRLPFTGVYAPKETGVTSVLLEPEDVGIPGRDCLWTVRSKGLSLPGTFARQVFRALEWIALDESIVQGKPFTNCLIVSPRDVCERLCWSPTQARVNAVEAAFQALAGIDLVPASAAPPGRSRRSSGSLRLLHILATGFVRSTGGTIGFSNYKLSFDERIAQSMNDGCLVPLNWALWTSLAGPVAQRLMEILESESARQPDTAVIALSRQTIHRLIPMSPAASLPTRQRLLDEAHQELIAAEYLSGVETSSSPSSEILCYLPGVAWHSLRLRTRRKPAVDHYQRMLQGMFQSKSGAGSPGSAPWQSRRYGGA